MSLGLQHSLSIPPSDDHAASAEPHRYQIPRIHINSFFRDRTLAVHELELISAAITHAIEVADQAGAQRIERLTFVLRPDAHISADTVRLLIEALGRGTPVEGASIEFELPKASVSTAAELVLTSVDITVEGALTAADPADGWLV